MIMIFEWIVFKAYNTNTFHLFDELRQKYKMSTTFLALSGGPRDTVQYVHINISVRC